MITSENVNTGEMKFGSKYDLLDTPRQTEIQTGLLK